MYRKPYVLEYVSLLLYVVLANNLATNLTHFLNGRVLWMKDIDNIDSCHSKSATADRMSGVQKITVFQQNKSGIKKIEGIRRFGDNRFALEIISIDTTLPAVIDDAREYIPRGLRADLVLDFLKHPDISHDLAVICRDRKIPVIASGKKIRVTGIHTPPT
jgi:hypothetical protein